MFGSKDIRQQFEILQQKAQGYREKRWRPQECDIWNSKKIVDYGNSMYSRMADAKLPGLQDKGWVQGISSREGSLKTTSE